MTHDGIFQMETVLNHYFHYLEFLWDTNLDRHHWLKDNWTSLLKSWNQDNICISRYAKLNSQSEALGARPGQKVINENNALKES